MAKFFYIARSQKGEETKGVMEAKDLHELSRLLHQEGLILISTEKNKDGKKKNFNISISFLEKVSLKDKMFFTRNLQVMISAGLSLPRALTILAEQSTKKKFKKAINEIKEEVVKGNSFSQSLALHPEIFSDLFQNMMKVGEESGTMEQVLKVLTLQMERDNELRSKILGALMYPAVIILAMLGIGLAMLVMVVPQLAQTFLDFGIELPATTKAVIFLGTFLAQKWYIGILLVVILVLALRYFFKTKFGKRIIDTVILKIPIISVLVKKTNSAYTTRTLSSLISAGVPLVRSLEIVSNTSAILAKLADFYEEEVANATKNISSIVEPILMLIIGGVIGLFAISMIQPMYSMLEGIK